ncbi:MAG: hypothetical protein N3A57_08280 [Negativicutes bacterium]|nr:hypothetical protein [Negativicutes bacterium]
MWKNKGHNGDRMDRLIRLQKKIAPEISEIMEERYNILRVIRERAPIGRRALATATGVGERVMRAQLDLLRDGELVSYSQNGAELTPAGEEVYNALGEYIRLFRGLSFLQAELASLLAVESLTIVPGDVSTDRVALRDLGKAAAEVLQASLYEDTILAVGGGMCVAAIAGGITRKFPGATVLAARGSVSGFTDFQANWVAVKLAERLGASYRLLPAYDGLSAAALQGLAVDGQISEYAEALGKVGLVVFTADLCEPAGRGLPRCGTALGQYFTLNGEWTGGESSLGLDYERAMKVPMRLLVVGGYERAAATVAVCRGIRPQALVIDEGVARGLAEII